MKNKIIKEVDVTNAKILEFGSGKILICNTSIEDKESLLFYKDKGTGKIETIDTTRIINELTYPDVVLRFSNSASIDMVIKRLKIAKKEFRHKNKSKKVKNEQ